MNEEVLYSNDDLRNRILNSLLKEDVFVDFTLNKGEKCIYKKDALGWFRISIANSWSSVDLHRKSSFSLCLSPGYSRRFNVLHRWYEPFDRSTIKEQRKKASVMIGHNVGGGYFDFLRSGDDFEKDYTKLKEVVFTEARPFFIGYRTLEGYYLHEVLPGIQGKKDLRKDTVFWAFEWLMATRIVAPESYESTKHYIIDYLYHSSYPISKIFRSYYEVHIIDILRVLESYDYKKDI